MARVSHGAPNALEIEQLIRQRIRALYVDPNPAYYLRVHVNHLEELLWLLDHERERATKATDKLRANESQQVLGFGA